MLSGKYIYAVNSSGTQEKYPLWTNKNNSNGSHFLYYKNASSTTSTITVSITDYTIVVGSYTCVGGAASTSYKHNVVLSGICPFDVNVGGIYIKSGAISAITTGTAFTSDQTVKIYNTDSGYSTYTVPLSSIGQIQSYTTNGVTTTTTIKETVPVSCSYSNANILYGRIFTDASGSLKAYTSSSVYAADNTTDEQCSSTFFCNDDICTTYSSCLNYSCNSVSCSSSFSCPVYNTGCGSNSCSSVTCSTDVVCVSNICSSDCASDTPSCNPYCSAYETCKVKSGDSTGCSKFTCGNNTCLSFLPSSCGSYACITFYISGYSCSTYACTNFHCVSNFTCGKNTCTWNHCTTGVTCTSWGKGCSSGFVVCTSNTCSSNAACGSDTCRTNSSCSNYNSCGGNSACLSYGTCTGFDYCGSYNGCTDNSNCDSNAGCTKDSECSSGNIGE